MSAIVYEQSQHLVAIRGFTHLNLEVYKGGYDYVDPEIYKLHYRKPPDYVARLKRGKLKRRMTTEEIRGLGLAGSKRKHAYLPQLVALGRIEPNLQKEGRILAWGSLTVIDGRECAAMLTYVCDERQLIVVSPDKDGLWPADLSLLVEES